MFRSDKIGFIPLLWMFGFILAPLMITLFLSFQSRGSYGEVIWNWGFTEWPQIFNENYLKIFFESFQLAFLTSVICFILSVLISWQIYNSSEGHKQVLLLLVALPFLISLVVRIYSIKILFSFDQNYLLVFFGMVSTYLPFMIFPILISMSKIPRSIIEAHFDLGGGHFESLFKIVLPNIKPAIANGFLMVFIPAFGEYVIPDMLGGAKNMLIGNLITEQFLKSRNWPFGAALSIALICFLVLIHYFVNRWGKAKLENEYSI